MKGDFSQPTAYPHSQAPKNLYLERRGIGKVEKNF